MLPMKYWISIHLEIYLTKIFTYNVTVFLKCTINIQWRVVNLKGLNISMSWINIHACESHDLTHIKKSKIASKLPSHTALQSIILITCMPNII